MKKILHIFDRYFAYFYDEDDILPKSVTPYRGLASFCLGWLYIIAVAFIYMFNETLGWIFFLVILAPAVIHVLFGTLNLLVFDIWDILADIVNLFRKKSEQINVENDQEY